MTEDLTARSCSRPRGSYLTDSIIVQELEKLQLAFSSLSQSKA